MVQKYQNGGLDQVKTELRPMGVPKNLPKEILKINLQRIFKAEELLQSNKLATQTRLETRKKGSQNWIKLNNTKKKKKKKLPLDILKLLLKKISNILNYTQFQ